MDEDGQPLVQTTLARDDAISLKATKTGHSGEEKPQPPQIGDTQVSTKPATTNTNKQTALPHANDDPTPSRDATTTNNDATKPNLMMGPVPLEE